jgi:hypothetical protein
MLTLQSLRCVSHGTYTTRVAHYSAFEKTWVVHGGFRGFTMIFTANPLFEGSPGPESLANDGDSSILSSRAWPRLAFGRSAGSTSAPAASLPADLLAHILQLVLDDSAKASLHALRRVSGHVLPVRERRAVRPAKHAPPLSCYNARPVAGTANAGRSVQGVAWCGAGTGAGAVPHEAPQSTFGPAALAAPPLLAPAADAHYAGLSCVW